ncbi:MAG: hypothetical protein K0R39_5107 [Symbiobacteriaceae bacterium]|jgi:hypothetical protein|nr:hypothetical protein [Symbiobacteriaceae bacterium]
MENVLGRQALAAVEARVAVLSVGKYALPVRFRTKGSAVECQVPTWSGVGDLLEMPGAAGPVPEVTLVAVEESEPHLRWLFIRGTATLVPDPDWEGLHTAAPGGVETRDLYQLLHIVPKRIEWADERRGWGYRETVDL